MFLVFKQNFHHTMFELPISFKKDHYNTLSITTILTASIHMMQ